MDGSTIEMMAVERGSAIKKAEFSGIRGPLNLRGWNVEFMEMVARKHCSGGQSTGVAAAGKRWCR